MKKHSSEAAALPKGRYHHGDLRQALLDEAGRVLAEHGVDAVRMNDLARKLGVSVAAPFRHFATREALLVAVAEAGATRMAAAMDAAAARQSDLLQAQRARGVAYVRFCVENPGIFRLLGRRDVVAASALLCAIDEAQRSAMEPVLGLHHAGPISTEVACRSAGLLAAQAMMFGLAQLLVEGPLGPVDAETAERLAHEVTGVLGVGLLREGTGAADP